MTDVFAVQTHWDALTEELQTRSGEIAAWIQTQCRQDNLEAWQKALLGSQFLQQQLFPPFPAQQERVLELLNSGDLQRSYPDDHYRQALLLDAVDSEEQLLSRLRQFRQREMSRLVFRDLGGLAAMSETARDVSLLAEACVDGALDWLYRDLCRSFGTPMGKDSHKPQRMVVLGMGKLGGYELNLSSDIDLIFSYPESGETVGGRRSLSNQEFFIKLGQRLIKAIDQVSAEGFVFRVDMRLRPYGQSGALVCNFDAMEDYYQTQGREWERYAMIKARVIAGDKAAGDTLMALLQPFTYRRYIDFSVIDSLRDMKSMIRREVQRRGLQDDVKLGPGGIREVEFIVQTFQLVRGGRDHRLQERSVLKLLPLLEELGWIGEGEAAQLSQAYEFLRNVEHALQAWKDEQTQSLPADENALARLAWVMGFAGVEAFVTELDIQRQRVSTCFAQVVAGDEEEEQLSHSWIALWESFRALTPAQDEVDLVDLHQHCCALLSQQGFAEGEQLWSLLKGFYTDRKVQGLAKEGRERLHKFMPLLLEELAQTEAPAEVLGRVLPLVESVLRRSAYLVLLTENPGACRQLLTLCGASPWFAEQLKKHPALLDELIDPRSLYRVEDQASLQADLRQQLLRVSPEDMEGQMDALRYFRLSQGLRIAACEVTGVLPLMKVSDHLTYLAEVILEHVVAICWQQLTSRHGYPLKGGEASLEPDFLIVGYGKLGGWELGHGSDLDLVFLHAGDSKAYTDGDKALDVQSFYMRLGQRIIHMLNTQTTLGQLYEVDSRLRPSGNSGMLVATLEGFERYQFNEAWVWEHQALVRARPVAGSQALAQQFAELRCAVLAQQRDEQELKSAVVTMRQKMREHLGSKGEEKQTQFQLKQDPGGIVDIEFLVQFAVLKFAHRYPALLRWSDNIRILETLRDCGLMAEEDALQLTEAYKRLRIASHRLALQQENTVVDGEAFRQERQWVQKLWQQWLEA